MFVCVECGTDSPDLGEQISPSVLKLSQCLKCESVVDKYIEYDGVLVLLDMLLLKTNVYRHVVFNRRQLSQDRAVYIKYSNGTRPPAASSTAPSLLPQHLRTTILLFLSYLTADTYISWLHDKQTDGKPNLHVLELQFIVRYLEVLVQTAAFYLVVVILGVVLGGVRDLSTLLSSLILSSFAKLFAIPSAIWSQDTNLLILAHLLVLANNGLVLRVMSHRRLLSLFIILTAFGVERFISYQMRGNVWPWDTLIAPKGGGNSTVGASPTLAEEYYWFYPPVGHH